MAAIANAKVSAFHQNYTQVRGHQKSSTAELSTRTGPNVTPARSSGRRKTRQGFGVCCEMLALAVGVVGPAPLTTACDVVTTNRS